MPEPNANIAKIITDAIIATAKENPQMMENLLHYLEKSGGIANGFLPNIARRLQANNQAQAALLLGALYGMIGCFGFWGFIIMLFKLRFGGKDARPS